MAERKISRIITAGLLIGTPLLLSGCESGNKQTTSQNTNRLAIPTPTIPGLVLDLESTTEIGIRKDLGSWSKTDIEKLANSMLSDSRFSVITHAGEILKGNATGNKTISAETPLFSDDRIKIETVKDFQKEYPDKEVPMDAHIAQNPPQTFVTIKSKRDGKSLTVKGGSSLRLERIRINKSFMEGKSDFLFHLLVAKEIYNTKAFDIVTSVIGDQVFSEYEIPDNQAIRNTIKSGFITWKADGGISMPQVGDLLAHFLILPDFNLAKDLNVITPDEQSNGAFWTLNQATDMLTKEGVFGKNPVGMYEWKGDTNTINSALIRIAWAGVRAGVMN